MLADDRRGERQGREDEDGDQSSPRSQRRVQAPQGVRRALEDWPQWQARRRLPDPTGTKRASPEEELQSREELDDAVGSILTSAAQLGSMDLSSYDVAELFCPGRFAEQASAFGLAAGSAFDLRTGWQLADEADRQEVWRRLHVEILVQVVGSPPCHHFHAAGDERGHG